MPAIRNTRQGPLINEQAIDEGVGDFISGHVLEKDSVFFEG